MRIVVVLAMLVAILPRSANAECEWITRFGDKQLALVFKNVEKLRQQSSDPAENQKDQSRPSLGGTSKFELERIRRISALPDPEDHKRSLRAGRIWIGATENQACLAWGKPLSVNRTTTQTIMREQWVYGSGSYLYFTNGVLTTIQN